MNTAIVRRLSFGSSARSFPMDKYLRYKSSLGLCSTLSAINSPETKSDIMSASVTWNDSDLDEVEKVEKKYENQLVTV